MTVIDPQKMRAAMTPKLDSDGTFDPTIFAMDLAEDLLACGMDLEGVYRFAEVFLCEVEADNPRDDAARGERLAKLCNGVNTHCAWSAEDPSRA